MIRVFFSYSHADEKYRNELEKHLMSLKHQGIIESWHDRRIVAGEEWAIEIDDELQNSNIILLLVSSDFIASHYCYEIEMQEALARHNRSEAVVIPIILRPCHWTGLPFGKLQAATKDGKPVEKYPSLDDAFLEVTQSIETVAKRLSASQAKPETVSPANSDFNVKQGSYSSSPASSDFPRSSNLAIPRTFTDHDRDTFLNEAFNYMATFFENSLDELKARNPEIKTNFQKVDSRSFEAIIYRNGSQSAKCGIWLEAQFGLRGSSSIMFNHAGLGQGNSFNESISVTDNGNILSLEPLGMSFQYHGRDEKTLTHQGAAEYYWSMFFSPVQRQL